MAYKVVRAEGKNKYYSPMVWNVNFRVKYIPNRFVKAKNKYLTFLSVFDSLENAKKFISKNNLVSPEIWECEILNGHYPRLANDNFPEGTIFADKVKITKKVNI